MPAAHIGTDTADGTTGTVTRAIPDGYHHIWLSIQVPVGQSRSSAVAQPNGDDDAGHYFAGGQGFTATLDSAGDPYAVATVEMHGVDGGHGGIAAISIHEGQISQDIWTVDDALTSVKAVANPANPAVLWPNETVFDWWGV